MPRARQQAPEGFVSVEEAARRLGIARANGYRLIKTGQLPIVERNGQTWVPVESIAARLESLYALTTDCIRTREVADFFGVHPVTVLIWHRKGLLPARRIANQLCFSAHDVVTLVPPGAHPDAPRVLRDVHYPAPS